MGAKPAGYRCLEYLLSQQDALNIKVTGIGTKARKEYGAGNDVSELALTHNIPLFSNPEDIPECDIIYSVQYHAILKADAIRKARQIAVNLHMAPLPEYRGCNQYSFAIMDGLDYFGTTVHVLDEGIDSGDILYEQRFGIKSGIWVGELYKQTLEATVSLFQSSLAGIVHHEYLRVPQASLVAERGSALYYRKDIERLKQVDLSASRDHIERQIRATAMPGFEPPYCIVGTKKLYLQPSV